MFLLAKLLPLLAGSDKVIVELARKGEQLELVVIPKLSNLKPDTDDAVIATLQAGLAMPFRCVVPADADPDAYVAEQIRQMAEKRAAPLSQLEAYTQELAQAAAAAKVAAEQAAAKKKTEAAGKAKGGGKATAPSATTAVSATTLAGGASTTADAADDNDNDDGDGDGDNAATAADAASTAGAMPPPPASAASLSLFDGL